MKYIAILFGLFILLVIVLADTQHLPRFIKVIYDFPYGDKLGHFILYGLLTFFVTMAFMSTFPNRTSKQVALWTGLVLALLIGLEEFSQRYFSSRTFDLIDLSASYLGVIVGGWVAYWLKKRQSPTR
jgi:VanZ family protein